MERPEVKRRARATRSHRLGVCCRKTYRQGVLAMPLPASRTTLSQPTTFSVWLLWIELL